MNIGINLVNYYPGVMGGVETYVRNLILHLQKIDFENSYTLFCSSDHEKEFQLFNERFRFAPGNYSKSSLKAVVWGILRNRFKIDLLRSEIDQLRLDMIHHPFIDIYPRGLKTPAIITFVDMQQEFHPEFFSAEELQWREKTYRPSVEKAVRVIAISGHVKQTLIDHYDVDPDKIDVTCLGYGPEYQVINDRDELESIKSKYQIDKPFMYYPAASWPHKNHNKLLRAFKILKDRYNFEGSLVLTGIAAQSHLGIITQIKLMGIENDVKVLGYLPYQELPYIYNLARLLVFPSLFEGFGIPLVEAMACGCPVVCSNVTSIPEIVGDAGVMFDPDSSEDMAEKLMHVWRDDNLIMNMRSKGIERCKIFTWENTALKTLEAYKKAFGEYIVPAHEIK